MSLAFPLLSGKTETLSFMGAILSPEAGACGLLREQTLDQEQQETLCLPEHHLLHWQLGDHMDISGGTRCRKVGS